LYITLPYLSEPCMYRSLIFAHLDPRILGNQEMTVDIHKIVSKRSRGGEDQKYVKYLEKIPSKFGLSEPYARLFS